MIDSLSKLDTIHFKKDISGLILYKEFISNLLIIVNQEIKDNSINSEYILNLNRLKNKFKLKIKHINKRIEMLK